MTYLEVIDTEWWKDMAIRAYANGLVWDETSKELRDQFRKLYRERS